jgi:DNA-binding PadR family transcriptional regulator
VRDQAARARAPIRAEGLTATSYLVLGMVQLGFASGYRIRKAAESSSQAFWPISLAQIYPELDRLRRAGLLSARSDPRGARARSAYAITASGAATLSAWLRSPEEFAPMRARAEGFLRLYFADILPLADQLALIDRIGDDERQGIATARALISFRAPVTVSYPALVGRFGVSSSGFTVRWLARIRARIEADGAARPRPAATRLRARPSPPIKLTPTSYLILAMIHAGADSGYAINKAAAGSTQAFWPTSFSDLYPQLGRMRAAGLLRARSDPSGRRERTAYSITERGTAALCAWLRSPHLTPKQMRFEALLRLFFCDAISASDQLVFIGRYRERCAEISKLSRKLGFVPVELDNLPPDGGYPALITAYASETFAHSARWLRRLERRLQAGDPPPLSPPASV